MSAQQYDRWYIVPPTEDDRLGTVPKYGLRDGIMGYSGALVDAEIIGENYAGLVSIYDEYDEFWIVRLYGTWSALNDISVLGDSRSLATNPEDVDAVLSQRFPGLNTSDWGARFFIK